MLTSSPALRRCHGTFTQGNNNRHKFMVYDVSNPTAPVYVTYLNTRTGSTGDRGPEGLTFISAAQSPNGKPLLIVGKEVSGATAIFQVDLTY